MNNLLLINTTGAIIDGVALIIILLSFIMGAKKGFVKTFLSVFGGLLSLLIAVLLCSAVARFLETRFGTVTAVSGWLEGVLSNLFGSDLMNTTLQEANESSLAEAGLAKWLLEIVISYKGTDGISQTITLNKIISPVFAYYIVAFLCIIGLYIIFRIIFYLIGEIVLKMHSLSLVRITDGILGAVLGLIRGVLIIDILLLLLSVIPIGFMQNIAVETDNTVITAFIGRFNLFGYILEQFLNGNISDIITDIAVTTLKR